MKRWWIDGICRSCGCLVIEGSSNKQGADYVNTCTNPRCENFRLHHIGDIERLCYYTHSVCEDECSIESLKKSIQ